MNYLETVKKISENQNEIQNGTISELINIFLKTKLINIETAHVILKHQDDGAQLIGVPETPQELQEALENVWVDKLYINEFNIAIWRI